jgi:DNA-binding IclR family transcriptional regulator
VRTYYAAHVAEWTFLTTHAQVLVCVARGSDNRLSRIADAVGITERATHSIVSDLVAAGYLTRHRVGRQSFYEVHAEMPLRHPLEAGAHLGDLLKPFLRRSQPTSDAAGSVAV